MKTININTDHDAANPDTKPGPYFVSAIDGRKVYIMAGPYATHAQALGDVKKAFSISCDKSTDGRARFMSWGTCRLEGSDRVGTLNKLGLI